jgi:hypothetical protein
VSAAREAFDRGPFPRMAPEERADAIRRLSEALKKRAPAIAEVISRENGCPARESMATQVFAATMVLDIHADMAKGFNWVEERAGALGNPVRVGRLPVGVCAGIIPWNVPLFIMALKLAPALAAGCTVVLKPSPETPLDPYLLGEAILEAELPPGVINIVAAGRETSEYLVSHPGIDKVSFTGSTATGRRVASLAARAQALHARARRQVGGDPARRLRPRGARQRRCSRRACSTTVRRAPRRRASSRLARATRRSSTARRARWRRRRSATRSIRRPRSGRSSPNVSATACSATSRTARRRARARCAAAAARSRSRRAGSSSRRCSPTWTTR